MYYLNLAILGALVTTVQSAITSNGVRITPSALVYCTETQAVQNLEFKFTLFTGDDVAVTSYVAFKVTAAAGVNVFSASGSQTTGCTGQYDISGTVTTLALNTDFQVDYTAVDEVRFIAHTNPLTGSGTGSEYTFVCTNALAPITAFGTPVQFDVYHSPTSTVTAALTNINGWNPGKLLTWTFVNSPSSTTPGAGGSPTFFYFETTNIQVDITNSVPLTIEGTQSWLDTGSGTTITGTANIEFQVTGAAAITSPTCQIQGSGTILACTPPAGGAGDVLASAVTPSSVFRVTVKAQLLYHSATNTQQDFTLRITDSTDAKGAQVVSSSLVHSGYINTAYTTSSGSGGASGDPVTYFGDTRTEFNLPIGTLTPIIKVPNFHLLASAFEGSQEGEQWIDRLLVTTPSGEKIADIAIKKDLLDFDRRRTPWNAFETLDVVMWDDRRLTPLPIFPPLDAYFPHAVGITITFARPTACPMNNATARVPCRECAHIASEYMKLLICAASAHEYFKGGYGSYKYAHLDFDVFDVEFRQEVKSQYGGVMPEIWGLVPMSNATRDMIKSQELIGQDLLGQVPTQVDDINASESTYDEIGVCSMSSCKALTSTI